MIGFTLVAVRVLPSSEFAIYMLAFGLIEAGRPLVSLGMIPMLQQFLPDMALHGSVRVLRRTIAVGTGVRLLLTALLVAACYTGWSGLLGWLGSTEVLTVSAWLVCAVVAAALMADYSVTILEALMHQRIAQPLRAILPIGKLCALLALYWIGALSLERLLWAELILATACALVGEWSVHRMISTHRPDGSRQYAPGSLLRFAWHMSGAQLLATAANPGVLRVVAARFLSVEALAQFAFYQQLALYVTRFMPSTQFASLIRPMLVARHAAGHSEVVSSSMALLWKTNLMVGILMLAAAASGGGQLAAWLYGREVTAGGVSIVLMLTVPALIAQENLASIMLQLNRETRTVRRLNLLALFAPIAVVLGAQWEGLPGAIAGLSLALALQSTVTMWVASRSHGGVQLDVSALMRIFGAAGVAAAVVVCARELLPVWGSWSGPISAILAGSLSLVLLIVFKPFNASDGALIGKIAPRLGSWVNLLSRRR